MAKSLYRGGPTTNSNLPPMRGGPKNMPPKPATAGKPAPKGGKYTPKKGR